MSDATRRLQRRPWFVWSMAMLIVSGCSRDAPPPSDAQSEPAILAGIPWTMEILGTDAALTEVEVTLTFADDSTFGGSAGCNRYFGIFSVGAADSIALGETGSTMMMCASPHMEQEGRYLGALRRVTSYHVTTDRLLLFEDSLPAITFVRGETSAD